MKPRLLDLFCGAGGAAMGYHRAGFEVVGVDINLQPRYPFEFHQGDALDWPLEGFDAYHASPPCQRYSIASASRPGLANTYPDLIGPIRDRFLGTPRPYVIENVNGARKMLRDPIRLCGAMFGRELYRHRLFETSFPAAVPHHPRHTVKCSRAGHWEPGTYVCIAGNCAPIKLAREAMDVTWTTRAELKESIPPAYTEWLGGELLKLISA